jgi:RNA polymerase sigma-70 factor (sigma-E family)
LGVEALTLTGLEATVEHAEFDEFFRATWPRLYRTAYAVAGDAAAAEDALQAAYARAFASWRRVRSAEHPEAYVRRIVVNEVIGTRRRGWWRRERPTDRVESAAAVPSPEGGVAERDRLWRAVLELPPRQRAVVVLRYYEDLSEEEIAQTLGCSRGTVKSQASAALTRLRQHAGLTHDSTGGEDA